MPSGSGPFYDAALAGPSIKAAAGLLLLPQKALYDFGLGLFLRQAQGAQL